MAGRLDRTDADKNKRKCSDKFSDELANLFHGSRCNQNRRAVANNFGVRRHVAAFKSADMSAPSKLPTGGVVRVTFVQFPISLIGFVGFAGLAIGQGGFL